MIYGASSENGCKYTKKIAPSSAPRTQDAFHAMCYIRSREFMPETQTNTPTSIVDGAAIPTNSVTRAPVSIIADLKDPLQFVQERIANRQEVGEQVLLAARI